MPSHDFPTVLSLKQIISFVCIILCWILLPTSLRETQDDNLLPFIKITSLLITYTPTAVIINIILSFSKLLSPLCSQFLVALQFPLCVSHVPFPKLILQPVFSLTSPLQSVDLRAHGFSFSLWYLLWVVHKQTDKPQTKQAIIILKTSLNSI